MCFDQTGKVSYTVIKSIWGSGWYTGIREDFFRLANGTIDLSKGVGSVKYKIFGDTIVLTSENGLLNQYNFYEDYNNSIPAINISTPFKFRCDTCVERIIGKIIEKKLYPCTSSPCDTNVSPPCIIKCDTLVVSPPISTNPLNKLPNVSVTASGTGNGIVTCHWTFKGASIGGSSGVCPPIDMTSGFGQICLECKNFMPNGDSCFCKQCITFCMNVISPTKSIQFVNNINQSYSIYPNPSSSYLEIKLNSEMASNTIFELIDINGKILKQINEFVNVGTNIFKMELKDVPKGNYIVRMNLFGESINNKIIIE